MDINIVDFFYVNVDGRVKFHRIFEEDQNTGHVTSRFHTNNEETWSWDNRHRINFPTEAEQRLQPLCFHLDEGNEQWPRGKRYSLNIPSMIRCQNCETNYPTKYQYQRHQCDFNAEKVVLKSIAQPPNTATAVPMTPTITVNHIQENKVVQFEPVDFEGSSTVIMTPPSNTETTPTPSLLPSVPIVTVMAPTPSTPVVPQIKFECNTCGKQFVSQTNLDRHKTSHTNAKANICEFCHKQFVSENRLRIHKENHCKKSGDVSKFYRSDVTVYKCRKCEEVFSSNATAHFHLMATCPDQDMKANDCITETDQLVDKLSTEILLQCEFCNRTYADKMVLLQHQKTHNTQINYECVICKESFDSYMTANQHWLKKCSDKASLFYLPKLIYCETCDRTFKSHELLYTHKMKKKHHVPKLHTQSVTGNLNGSDAETNTVIKRTKTINQDGFNRLVEDVLIALDAKIDSEEHTKKEPLPSNDEDEMDIEEYSTVDIENDLNRDNADIVVNKKKRGRKRKVPLNVSDTALLQNLSNKNKLSIGNGRRISSGSMTVTSDNNYRYQCERCAAVFTSISDLEAHKESEHAANFSCDECGQVLPSARALLVHSRAHKCLKPYVCDTCGRSYSQTSHLWQHMRFHQGIKPFACPHEGCEARYTIRPDLKDHIRKVHTRERPFKCAVCSKCFLTGSVYYQHRLIHTEDRRYGCDVITKSVTIQTVESYTQNQLFHYY